MGRTGHACINPLALSARVAASAAPDVAMQDLTPKKRKKVPRAASQPEMFNVIIGVFIIFGIFSIIASLFTLYVWYADPYQFAIWKATLRSRWDSRGDPAP